MRAAADGHSLCLGLYLGPSQTVPQSKAVRHRADSAQDLRHSANDDLPTKKVLLAVAEKDEGKLLLLLLLPAFGLNFMSRHS